MNNKKKFKDTKLGKSLLNIIPSTAGIIGDILPDKGLLGIVKNIISDTDISEEDREALTALHADLEKEYLKDAQNARDNETEIDTDPNSSMLSKNIHEIIALIFVCGWFLLLWFAIHLFINASITINQLVLILAATGLKDMVLLILGYLYGRTKPQK